jgi:hypothetical protein
LIFHHFLSMAAVGFWQQALNLAIQSGFGAWASLDTVEGRSHDATTRRGQRAS